MGLDMYLSKRTKIVKVVNNESEELMYWRKQNAIHKWFVDNVQNGEDDCNEYEVSREQLEELLAICKEILLDKTKAQVLLPTTNGFFFGGVEYDGWYFNGIKETAEVLPIIIKNLTEHDKVYYQSSW